MSYHLVTFLQSPANANPPQGGSQLGQSHDSTPFRFDIPGDGLELFVTGVVKTQRLVTSQVHGSSDHPSIQGSNTLDSKFQDKFHRALTHLQLPRALFANPLILPLHPTSFLEAWHFSGCNHTAAMWMCPLGTLHLRDCTSQPKRLAYGEHGKMMENKQSQDEPSRHRSDS